MQAVEICDGFGSSFGSQQNVLVVPAAGKICRLRLRLRPSITEHIARKNPRRPFYVCRMRQTIKALRRYQTSFFSYSEYQGVVKIYPTPARHGLTFALLGVFERPLRFFADSKKTASRSAAGFSPTLSPIFLATFVKVSILGHARSGHQVRSSDHTLQKLYNHAPAPQCLRDSYETFGIW